MKRLVWQFVCCIAVMIMLSPRLMAEVHSFENYGEEDGLTLYRMSVTSAAEPQPALKHRMWLRPHQLKPGNAAMHYVRIFAENWFDGAWRSVTDRYGDQVYEWIGDDIPIEELPLEDVRWAASQFDSLIEHAIGPGTTCRESDWGLELMDLRGLELIEFRLPEFQQLRGVCRMLSLRTRVAIAERRYDDAIEHLRMNYRVGHDVGQEMFLVCNLIGIAVEGIANLQVIDLIAAPDSPNLYWALSEVPNPLVNCTRAIRLEMSLGQRIFPALMDAETAEHSPREWARLLSEGVAVFHSISSGEGIDSFGFERESLQGFAGLGVSFVGYPMAKQRLVDSGMSAERVEQMPVGQVMLVDAAREYRRMADEVEKWWYVPYAEARIRMREAEHSIGKRSPLNAGRAIADLLLPAVRAVHTAQIRSAWKKNALMVIEALRMHAAETGSFPESLEQVQVVPVPMNPITTEPYWYHLDGDTAVLELPFSDGMPGIAYRYEITLAEP